MAYGRIGDSGCKIRKGKIKLLFRFYLEPGDARYEEHHVTVPVIPSEGYPCKVQDGVIVDPDDYKKWLVGLPTEERNNPFHNHFEHVSDDAGTVEIAKLLQSRLAEFYGIWAAGKSIVKASLRPGPRVTTAHISEGQLETKLRKIVAGTQDMIV